MGLSLEEVQKEANTITALGADGGHENIIDILNHGWSRFDFYFIDLEYCDWTLSEYFDFRRATKSCNLDTHTLKLHWPAIYLGPQPDPFVNNVYTIGNHIVRGLQYMHSKRYAHRDLKPTNGN